MPKSSRCARTPRRSRRSSSVRSAPSRVLRHRRLGDLQAQVRRAARPLARSAASTAAAKPGRASWRAETLTRDADAPLGRAAGRLAQHEAAERDDQPGLLGDRRRTPRGSTSHRHSASKPATRLRGRAHDRLEAELAASRPRSRGAGRPRARAARGPGGACVASKTAWRALPSALARYMATSASRISSSGSASRPAERDADRGGDEQLAPGDA